MNRRNNCVVLQFGSIGLAKLFEVRAGELEPAR